MIHPYPRFIPLRGFSRPAPKMTCVACLSLPASGQGRRDTCLSGTSRSHLGRWGGSGHAPFGAQIARFLRNWTDSRARSAARSGPRLRSVLYFVFWWKCGGAGDVWLAQRFLWYHGYAFGGSRSSLNNHSSLRSPRSATQPTPASTRLRRVIFQGSVVWSALEPDPIGRGMSLVRLVNGTTETKQQIKATKEE